MSSWRMIRCTILLLLTCLTAYQKLTNGQVAAKWNAQKSTENAKREVLKFCNRKVYPFVECIKKKHSFNYDVKAGSFGAGVIAKIYNNPPKYGVNIYKNCAPAELGLGVLTPQCLLKPTEKKFIKVFLKIIQESANLSNSMSSDQGMTAFQKECRRTRSAAILILPQPVQGHISPAFYEIQDVNTAQPHYMMKSAYLQELVVGDTADALRIALVKNAKQRLEYHMKKVIFSTTSRQVVLDAAKTAIWGDFSLFLKLLDVIFVTTLNLWGKKICHCDLHFGNIMLTKTYITDLVTLNRLIDNREAIFPDYVEEYTDKELTQKNADGTVGVAAYILLAHNVRFIDTAYMVSVEKVPEADDQPPCLFYRAQREEDLNELWRGGMDYIFNRQHADTFEVVKNSVKPRQLNSYQTGQLNALYAIWHQTRSSLMRLSKDVLNVYDLKECQRMRQNKTKNKTLKELLRKTLRVQAMTLLGASCSLKMQRRGLMQIRNILNNELNKHTIRRTSQNRRYSQNSFSDINSPTSPPMFPSSVGTTNMRKSNIRQAGFTSRTRQVS